MTTTARAALSLVPCGPGCCGQNAGPDKLLKDAFCISFKKTKFILISATASTLEFASYCYTRYIQFFHFPQIAGPKNCGPCCCSTPGTLLMRHWQQHRRM